MTFGVVFEHTRNTSPTVIFNHCGALFFLTIR